MQTTESLKRKIQSAQDLLGVVKTMKALAAVSIRQYQRAVESLAEYNRTVEMGLEIALKKMNKDVSPVRKASVHRIGAIVFGSDQGLCGQLNAGIANYAMDEMAVLGIKPENRSVICIGMRPADILEDMGQNIIEVLDTPSSTASITPMVQDITMILEEWRFRQQLEHVYLYYSEYISGANYRPKTLRILPVDQTWLESLRKKKWVSRTLPTFTMDWENLFRSLVREYLFVSLYRAFAESLASENASRLAAMQNAEKNIEERLEELFVQFHRQRQMIITEELLDIVAGFEALTGKKKKSVPKGGIRHDG